MNRLSIIYIIATVLTIAAAVMRFFDLTSYRILFSAGILLVALFQYLEIEKLKRENQNLKSKK